MVCVFQRLPILQTPLDINIADCELKWVICCLLMPGVFIAQTILCGQNEGAMKPNLLGEIHYLYLNQEGLWGYKSLSTHSVCIHVQ